MLNLIYKERSKKTKCIKMKLTSVLKFIIVFIFTAFLTNCRNNSSKTKEVKPPIDAAKPVDSNQAAINLGEVKLMCRDLGTDSFNTPHFMVILLARGKETKIKNINGCGEIPKTEYKKYDIPGEAISACGGWWAGAGDYYYVVLKKDSAVLFSGWMDETQKEKSYHWKKIMIK
jgi:hypothetical protein